MKGKLSKKILFCDNTLWGLVNFRSYIFTHLRNLGYQVVLVAPQDEKSVMQSDIPEGMVYRAVRLKRCAQNVWDDFRYFCELYQIYKDEHPDLIFHYTIKPNVYGTFASRLLGIPCINMMAGLGYAFQDNGILNRCILYLYRFAMNRAWKVICLNEENKKIILKNRFCQEQSLVLLKGGEGVDLQMFHNSGNTTFEEAGDVVFLMVARLLVDKGYRVLVDAVRLLKQQGIQGFRCCVLGPIDVSYPTHVPLEELQADQAEGMIEYWGVVNRVQDILSMPNIVMVLPSFYPEGLNRSLMEACAMGKPIITTDIPGCRETVDHGKNGFLVPPCDAQSLARAMADFLCLSLAEKRKFSFHSRKKAENTFDIKHVLAEYVRMLGEQGL